MIARISVGIQADQGLLADGADASKNATMTVTRLTAALTTRILAITDVPGARASITGTNTSAWTLTIPASMRPLSGRARQRLFITSITHNRLTTNSNSVVIVCIRREWLVESFTSALRRGQPRTSRLQQRALQQQNTMPEPLSRSEQPLAGSVLHSLFRTVQQGPAGALVSKCRPNL
jgi:hypothetical protein